MSSDVVRCGNCLAPLSLDAGPIVTCAYCAAQTRLDVAEIVARPVASGVRLAETIAFVVTPTFSIPLLEANSPVPLFRTETLSTSRDDQDTFHVSLAEGKTLLTTFEFPIRKRGPRGVPKIRLTVRVSARGAMSLTLAEEGSDNTLDRDGMTVRVVA